MNDQLRKLMLERDELLENVHTLAADLERAEAEPAEERDKILLRKAKDDQETLIGLVQQFEHELKELREQNAKMSQSQHSLARVLINFGKAVSHTRKKVASNLDSIQSAQNQSLGASLETLSQMVLACSESLLSTFKKLGSLAQQHLSTCPEHTEGLDVVYKSKCCCHFELFAGLTQELAIALEYIQHLDLNNTENIPKTEINPVLKSPSKQPGKPPVPKPIPRKPPSADEVFNMLDVNGDGVLTRQEFGGIAITA